MQDELVSIIVRNCSTKRLYLLDQALFSIFGSYYKSIEVIVVVQTEDDEHYYEVKELADKYSQLGLSVRLAKNKTFKDERAKNLNIGIREARGRYIGFLDDDDVIYPEHISLLINIVNRSKFTAWAYSDVAIVNCDIDACGNLYMLSRQYQYKRDRFSYPDLWIDNYIPVHTYIIDRERVDSYFLQFDESMIALEDYAFILKLASIYEPKYVNKVTCEYRLRLDGSNTILFGAASSSRIRIWEEARNKLERVREELLLSWSFNRDGKYSPITYKLVKFFQSHLQQTQAELERLQSHLQQTQAELERSQSHLQQTQAELEYSQNIIKAMQTSKFWKLRKTWFRLKQIVGLGRNE